MYAGILKPGCRCRLCSVQSKLLLAQPTGGWVVVVKGGRGREGVTSKVLPAVPVAQAERRLIIKGDTKLM